MTEANPAVHPPVAQLREVILRYGEICALKGLSLAIPSGCMAGIIGPDGVGKSSLLALLAGARQMQQGEVTVLDGDIRLGSHRAKVCHRIAFMPQGLGSNLYPSLSVRENLEFFARLFSHDRTMRQARIDSLLRATGLDHVPDRTVGKLSGGMKQKLGLCCALIHEPELMILDEPTTGIDPLSRRQFWDLVSEIRRQHPGMSVIVASATMEEARTFDWLAVMDAGQVLDTGTPQALLEKTDAQNLEEAFIQLLPAEKRDKHHELKMRPAPQTAEQSVAIEAEGLTVRFGDFTAVENVSFRIKRGEIFGFLGSNGCGKTTTMKVLTGLLSATEGEAWVFGQPVSAQDIRTRLRVGYMTQSFSLYGELTVRQNLWLHARLFNLRGERLKERVDEMASRFGLEPIMDSLPGSLPLGERQRLSLAVAMIHDPEILILDEPTSGVDPITRDAFWHSLMKLAREDGVTIFISTHYMNEAERCDRISLMHAGRVLISDTPKNIMQQAHTSELDDAFVHFLQAETESSQSSNEDGKAVSDMFNDREKYRSASGLQRLLSYAHRETLELLRDPIRLSLAAFGSLLMMLILGYGISMDVEDLRFAVLDHDQTLSSRDYVLGLSGSRYFIEQPALMDQADMEQRLRSGELSLALEIPHGFARDLQRGSVVEIAALIDGSMPTRAETIRGYLQGMHQHWLATQGLTPELSQNAPASIETRFRYNPDVRSLPAMVPAVIPLLLMLVPAILAAMSVVREKELGSIINFYVTPTTRLEFLLGKQIPYIAVGMLSFFMLVLLAIGLFAVPITGSFMALTLGAFLYICSATAFGLLVSSFMRSQIAALFGTAILTMLPATAFSGMMDPVSSLEGMGRLIGEIYPTTHFIDISRGMFSKALAFSDLKASFFALAVAPLVLLSLAVLLLKKQAR